MYFRVVYLPCLRRRPLFAERLLERSLERRERRWRLLEPEELPLDDDLAEHEDDDEEDLDVLDTARPRLLWAAARTGAVSTTDHQTA